MAVIEKLTDLPPCETMHTSSSCGGWDVVSLWFTPDVGPDILVTHTTPCADTHTHQLCHTCWCSPTLDDESSFHAIHHSADGREDYDSGRRKPN